MNESKLLQKEVAYIVDVYHRKLEPAHYLTWSAGETSRPQSYWALKIGSNPDTGLADALRDKLQAAVKVQLVSDVPVGVFLSGGIDSSAIAAIATQVRGRRPIKTFSLGFAEASYDERPFARAVARHYGTDHTEIEFSARDAARRSSCCTRRDGCWPPNVPMSSCE